MAEEKKEKKNTNFSGKNWCFTKFEIEDVKWDANTMQYLIYQEEESPQTKKHHLQGFVQLLKKTKFNTVKQLLGGDKVHLEMMRGTAREASDYCKKEESRVIAGKVFEGGELRLKGARNDLKRAVEMIREGATQSDLIDDEQTIEVVAKYGRFIEEVREIEQTKRGQEFLKKKMEDIELYPWQDEVAAMCQEEPEDRKVIWVADEKGGSGKSVLAKWLMVEEGAANIGPGRFIDMAYTWSKNPTKVVCIDVSRTNQKHADYDPLDGVYSFVEALKNGIVHSTKYIPKTIVSEPPHVVIFANFLPAMDKLTADRWVIVKPNEISEEKPGAYKPQ